MDTYAHGDSPMSRPDPVRVHLTGSDIPMSAHREQRRPRRGVTFRTYVLTTGENAIAEILPLNSNRCEAWVQGLDNDFTVYGSRADAQSGAGGITIPAFNRAPYPLNTTDRVWAKASTNPTTICVTSIIEEY